MGTDGGGRICPHLIPGQPESLGAQTRNVKHHPQSTKIETKFGTKDIGVGGAATARSFVADFVPNFVAPRPGSWSQCASILEVRAFHGPFWICGRSKQVRGKLRFSSGSVGAMALENGA